MRQNCRRNCGAAWERSQLLRKHQYRTGRWFHQNRPLRHRSVPRCQAGPQVRPLLLVSHQRQLHPLLGERSVAQCRRLRPFRVRWPLPPRRRNRRLRKKHHHHQPHAAHKKFLQFHHHLRHPAKNRKGSESILELSTVRNFAVRSRQRKLIFRSSVLRSSDALRL